MTEAEEAERVEREAEVTVGVEMDLWRRERALHERLVRRSAPVDAARVVGVCVDEVACGEMWGDMGRYAEICGDLGRSGGEIWGDIERSGEIWGVRVDEVACGVDGDGAAGGEAEAEGREDVV